MSPISPVTHVDDKPTTAPLTQAASPQEQAVVRKVADAVKSLNEADYAGAGRELTFSIDQTTRLPVVKVIDVNTNEVVTQWPSSYVIALAAVNAKSTEDPRLL